MSLFFHALVKNDPQRVYSLVMCVFRFVVFRFSVRQIVYEKCHHPFVLRMDYAFQTEHHAIIVLNLVTTGNIQVSR